MTPTEVAQLVRVSRRTVMRAIKRGELDASQLASRCWRIWPDAVERWKARSSGGRAPVATQRPAVATRPLVVREGMGRGR